MSITPTFFRHSLLSGLALSFILLFTPAAHAKNAYVSVTKDGTIIRTTPSDKGAKHGEVFAGFPLKVLERKGDWAQVVDFEGDKGWVSNSMISPRKSVIVKEKKVSLRESPNSDAGNQIVVNARYGVTFAPLEVKGEWIMLRHEDGTEGWVKNDQVWPANPFEISDRKPAAAASGKAKKQPAKKATPKKIPTKTKKTKGHRK